MSERQSPESQAASLLDLGQLKFRIENGEDNNRRGHDLRRTFITLAQVDGARRDILETVSHGPRGDIMNIFTTLPWQALCGEVSKLKISLREGLVFDGDFQSLTTRLATTQQTREIVGQNLRPQRDSNPRSSLERALSWAGLDDGVRRFES